MTSVNGINKANIVKCVGVGISSINKMSGVTFASPLINQSMFRPGASSSSDITHRIIMPTTQEPTTNLRLIESDSFTVNFWVKAGWTSALNTAVGLFSLGANATTSGRADSAYNNVFRIFYNEPNNRLYVGWLNRPSSSNLYAHAYWPMHYSTARTTSGLGSTYWSSTNRGKVNANGFTMVTITVTGTTSGTAIMSSTNVKGYWNGVSLGSTFVSNGEQNGDPSLTTTDPRGMSLIGLPYGNSGTLNDAGGAFGGNGAGTIMSEVSVWDGVLSQSEITALYNSGNGGSISKITKPTNLIAYWNFDSNSTGTEGGEPFSYPVWPDPADNGNLGKVQLNGSSDFVSGGTNVIS